MDNKMIFEVFNNISNASVYQKKKALSLVVFFIINTIVLVIALFKNFTILGLIGSSIIEICFFISKTKKYRSWSCFSENMCQLLFADTVAFLIINLNALITSESSFDLSTASYNTVIWILLFVVGGVILYFNRGSNLFVSWVGYCTLYIGLAYLCLFEDEGWPTYVLYYYLFFFIINTIWHIMGFASVNCKCISDSDEKWKNKRLEFHYLSIILFSILAILFAANRFVFKNWLYNFPFSAIEIISKYSLFACISICSITILCIIISYSLDYFSLEDDDINQEEYYQNIKKYDEITLLFVSFVCIAIRVAFEWYFPFEIALFIFATVAFIFAWLSESGTRIGMVSFDSNLLWLCFIFAVVVFAWIDLSKGKLLCAICLLLAPCIFSFAKISSLNMKVLRIIVIIWCGLYYAAGIKYDFSSSSNYLMIAAITAFIVFAYISLVWKRPDNWELNNRYYYILLVVFVLLVGHASSIHGVKTEITYNETQTKMIFEITAKGDNCTIQEIEYGRNTYQWQNELIEFRRLDIDSGKTTLNKTFKIKSNCLELRLYDSNDEVITVRKYYPYTLLNPEESIVFSFIASF